MRIRVTRLAANRLPPREFVWTVADVEKLYAFHAHAKDALLSYEARPYTPEP